MDPVSPYGCAKVYSYNICKNYRNSYGLFLSNGILFNHESPRRGTNFVTNKVVKEAVKIHLGLSAIVDSAGYQSLGVPMKRLIIKQFISGAKKETMEELQSDASLVPYLVEYNFSNIPKDQLRIIYDAIGKDYLNTMLKEFQK